MIDWNREPYVTGTELAEMPGWQRDWFTNQPNIWRQVDFNTDVLYNLAHPKNSDIAARDLIRAPTNMGVH